MSIIRELGKKIDGIILELGYEVANSLTVSNRPDLGDYQINAPMMLAKKYHKAPQVIADEIINSIKDLEEFKEVSVAGPGFINIKLSDSFLQKSMTDILNNFDSNIDKVAKKHIFMDYGGANIAKTLHVGHLRPADIGEGVKRVCERLGCEVTADVHFGDIGKQSGVVISEIKRRYPSLPYFDENYNGDYSEVDFKITPDELGEIYPAGNIAAKESEERMQEVIDIEEELENGKNKGYVALWDKVKEVSIEDIKELYKKLNTTFDLFEGETDSLEFIPKVLEKLEKENILIDSEGAKIVEVKRDDDNAPMPPLVVVKSNGATVYGTRDLATIYSRIKRFDIDEIWYFTDNRQSLYFEQVFRAAYLGKLLPENIKLSWFGIGAMTDKDGSPFKTRDGGVMSLKELIEVVKKEAKSRLNKDLVKENEEEISEQIAIATLKYADYLPFRSKDFAFDPEKFSDLDGKTAPYIMYSTVRMNSLLNKAEESNSITKLTEGADREVMLLVLEYPNVLLRAYEDKSLSELAEYIYKLTSTYNRFYNDNHILTCEDIELKTSWIGLTKLIYNLNLDILNILGIELPEKM